MDRMDDDVFVALADADRRRLLVELRREGRIQLLERSGETDHDLPQSDAIADDERGRIRMVHCHLPKLADYGFLEWDRDAGVVETGPRFEQLVPVLDLLEEWQDEDAASVPRDANGRR